MNWDAISAISEVAGVVAVVITLAYLVRETRKNAEAIDATSSREAFHQISDWHLEVARDPELKRITLKSVSPDSDVFTGEEWFEFRLLAISLFHIYQSHFVHRSLNVGSEELSRINIRYAQSIVTSWPAWRRFWEEEVENGTFLQGFVDAVNRSDGADYSQLAESREIAS